MKDVDEICNIENVVINNFKEEEKGYFLPFEKEIYLKIVNNPVRDGEIYAAFIDNKMVAWIFLSVSNRMKELKQKIPNLEGECADIDGVIVLPEYRGYGLQKILVKYLEERAREKGINNIIAEVTFGNVYSLRNLKDLEMKARKRDKLACYILGRSYDSEENGAEQSFEKEMYWYEGGKELGDPRSAYGVGACYYFGGGVEQDKEKAKQIHNAEFWKGYHYDSPESFCGFIIGDKFHSWTVKEPLESTLVDAIEENKIVFD